VAPEFPVSKKILQRISRETGGGFLEVSKKQPLDAGPGYRHLHLTPKDKALTVQAREGYYAA
jgi:hypothetical protein